MENESASHETSHEIKLMVPGADFGTTLELFTGRLGFRIDMIFPANEPSVALISSHATVIRLEKLETPGSISSTKQQIEAADDKKDIPTGFRPSAQYNPIISLLDSSKWIMGRAGMEYRDLIPGRLGGRFIASHIRLADGGVVADYVHYHKVDFQMIYCKNGRIKVVYEDQGEPFWLKPGDCVLQPPEIRHRVLEATAGAQVVEIGSPAIHESWADHYMILPTARVVPDRDFGGQRFVRHIAADSPPILGEYGDFEARRTGISAATGGFADVFELRSQGDHSAAALTAEQRSLLFYFVLSGRLTMSSAHFGEHKFTAGDSIVVPPDIEYELDSPANSEILCVFI